MNWDLKSDDKPASPGKGWDKGFPVSVTDHMNSRRFRALSGKQDESMVGGKKGAKKFTGPWADPRAFSYLTFAHSQIHLSLAKVS